MYSKNILASAIAGTLTLLTATALAQANETLEEVNVTTSPLDNPADAVVAPVSVLKGDELRRAASATLGETLKDQLGVANASFGSGVGLPIIRGQGANRVKVLSNNLDVADASNTSSDHATSVEPLLAESVEILRGPATLRYGSGAIGGVINVIDGRIPTKIPEKLEGALEMRHDTGNDQNAGVFRLSGGQGEFAWYLDGAHRKSGDTEIPGLAIRHHEDEAEEGEHDDEFNTDGFVGNTNASAKSASAGGSWITDRGFVGLSINRLENNYGIPLGSHMHSGHGHDDHDHDHDHDDHDDHGHDDHAHGDEEAVRIDMVQTRYDLKGEYNFNSEYWDKIRFRLGHSNYEHVELEDNTPSTRFNNDSWDSRLELTHDDGGEWRGAYGLQLSTKDFSTSGNEAFIQSSKTDSVGAYVMKERSWQDWQLDLGARLEKISVDPELGKKQNYNLVSMSTALQYLFTEHQHLSFSLTSAERAPVAEELFADGAHVAESRYLLGNDALDKENSFNLELGYHHHNEEAQGWHAAKVEVNVFYNHIDDYIYARNDDREDEDSEFPVYVYMNRDATFYGAEASVTFPLMDSMYLTFFGDSVQAQFDDSIASINNTDDKNVPFLPPLRFGFALGGNHGPWSWNWRNTRAMEQTKPGAFEEPVDAYTRMDLSAQYTLQVAGNDMLLFASANNLLDEEIRNATSPLRDFAPEVGRSLEAGIRFNF